MGDVRRRVTALEGADGADADLCQCAIGDGAGQRVLYTTDEGEPPTWRSELVDTVVNCVRCGKERPTLTIRYTRDWPPGG